MLHFPGEPGRSAFHDLVARLAEIPVCREKSAHFGQLITNVQSGRAGCTGGLVVGVGSRQSYHFHVIVDDAEGEPRKLHPIEQLFFVPGELAGWFRSQRRKRCFRLREVSAELFDEHRRVDRRGHVPQRAVWTHGVEVPSPTLDEYLRLQQYIEPFSGQIDGCNRNGAEQTDLAAKAFELSQMLQEKWVKANVRAKRSLLEIVCLKFLLDGATLVPEIRKPIDEHVEGLSVPSSRAERI